MPEDARRVARALAGEELAWREIFARHAPRVRRVVAGFASLSAADLEDVVQDTFVRAYHNLAQLRQPEQLGAWLLTIARSRALNRLRGQQTQRRLGRAYAEDPAVGLRAPRGDAEAAERARRVQIVRELIAHLPEGPEAETVRLFYVEGQLSAREIAARLGVGKSTVTMRLERFRARVKARLAARLLAAGEEPA